MGFMLQASAFFSPKPAPSPLPGKETQGDGDALQGTSPLAFCLRPERQGADLGGVLHPDLEPRHS